MKITFISNFLSHHQFPFSNEMYKLLGNNYTFISTKPMNEERKKMGWNLEKEFPYELKIYEFDENRKKALELVNDSDIVIIGSAPDSFIYERLKANKITFKYSERLYKEGLNLKKFPRAIYSSWIHHGKFQKYPIYMLCASAYTARDLNIFRNYKDRMFKWGYFPQIKNYNIKHLLESKNNTKIEILWAGRFIDWKHAEHAIEIIRRLDRDGYDFKFKIIGTGSCEWSLKELVNEYDLTNKVEFLGTMSPNQVRECMEKSNIYLFTSDFQEGWGAVLNEAMNSGCAVVASHAIGSVPFLLKHEENGLIYKYGDLDDFYNQVKKLIDNKKLQNKLGNNAYLTIKNLWNEEVAAQRFIKLCECMLKKEKIIFNDGPCSNAEIIRNDWL